MIHILMHALLFVQLSAPGTEGTAPVQVRKTIVKKYSAVTNQQLVIDNQYGNVEVKAWPKKEILINITYTTSAPTDAEAERLSKKITILDNRSPGQISCHTVISQVEDSQSNDSSVWEDQLKIEYKVFTPPGQSIRIKNEFGNIELTGCSGHITIDEAFGNFKADNIAIDSLKLDQGDILIAKLMHGKITVKGFELVNIGSVTGNVSCKFELGRNLNITLPKGKYNFGLDTKNVARTNVQFARGFSPNLSLETSACNFFNSSKLVLKEVREKVLLTIVGKRPDSSNSQLKIIPSKKGDSLITGSPVFIKDIHFHTTGSAGKPTIEIKSDFGWLTFK